MPTSYWPFDNRDTTETEFSQWARRLQHTGVWGDPSDNALQPFADSSGLFYKIRPGYAFVRGHMVWIPEITSLPVDGGGSVARTDLIVLRLNPALDTILPTVIKGPDPAPIQTDNDIFDLVIGAGNVPASASTIVPSDITDRRTFAGHIWGLWPTAGRPTAASVPPLRMGQPGFNSTKGEPEYWNGTAWKTFSPEAITAAMISPTEQAKIDAGRIGGNKISVQPSAPAAPTTNDIWLW